MYSFDKIDIELTKLKTDMQSFQYEISDCGVRVFTRFNPGAIPQVEHPINEVRGSLRYRVNSIVYHIHILISQRHEINKRIEEEFSKQTANPISIENLIIHQYYFFDDIIFNLLSMFDYIAGMIGFMFENKYYKWNSLVRSAKNKNSTIGQELFSSKIIEFHRVWVDPLIQFRSDIIHRSPKFGEESINRGGYKRDIPNFSTIKVHGKLNRLIKKIAVMKNLEAIDVIDCSILLARHSFKSCDELLKGIK